MHAAGHSVAALEARRPGGMAGASGSAGANSMSAMPTSVRSDPAELILGAVDTCLDLAATWYAWDGRPRVSEPTKDIPGGTVFTPQKAIRRIADHLVDHLAELEALLAGAEPIPDSWHGRTVTLASDCAPFTEADLNEARNRLGRLGQLYALRLRSLDDEAVDAPGSGADDPSDLRARRRRHLVCRAGRAASCATRRGPARATLATRMERNDLLGEKWVVAICVMRCRRVSAAILCDLVDGVDLQRVLGAGRGLASGGGTGRPARQGRPMASATLGRPGHTSPPDAGPGVSGWDRGRR